MEWTHGCAGALQWLAYVGLVLFLLYKYLTKNFDFWERQNVPFVKPRVLLGSFQLGKKPLQELEKEWYEKYGRIYGRFDGTSPVLSVADPELLKRIFVKDFHIFPNRRDLKFSDPIMDNTLFVLEGEAWRRVRSIVSPTLTSAKLKKLLPLLQECADVLINNLTEGVRRKQNMDCQRMFGAFNIDAIGRCAFGININSLNNENDPFVAKARLLLQCAMSWRTIVTMLFPKLMKLLRLKLMNPETMEFYKGIILELVEKRKKNNVTRDDFLQLLLDAECEVTDPNNNAVKTSCTASSAKDIASHETKQTTNKVLSHDEFLAQCVSFFLAGYDATTSLMSYAVYNLAMHQEYQVRIYEEINRALDNNSVNLNYETLAELKFMDAVLNECLRLCPPLVRSERRAEEDYVMGQTGIVIKKGMLVSIPVYALHRDPEWYPEPEVFRPERFISGDSSRPQYVHLPFGAGPRLCIGMRFVQMEVKMCLAKLLRKFQVLPASSTPDSLGYTEARGILKVNNVEVSLIERCDG